MNKIESYCKDLVGIIPCYDLETPATMLIMQNRDCPSVIDSRTIETVKQVLAGYYAVDLEAQAKILRKRLGGRMTLPFYLSGPT